MFDDQHDCQASVGSSVLVRTAARMRIAVLPQQVFLSVGPSIDQGDRFPLDGVPTGTRGACPFRSSSAPVWCVRRLRLHLRSGSFGFAVVPSRAGVVNLEHIMDAPSDDDILTLFGSARDEALREHRRRNLVASHGCLRVILSHFLMFHSSVRLFCP